MGNDQEYIKFKIKKADRDEFQRNLNMIEIEIKHRVAGFKITDIVIDIADKHSLSIELKSEYVNKMLPEELEILYRFTR